MTAQGVLECRGFSELRLREEISRFGRRVPLTLSSRLREVIGSLKQ